MRLLGARLTLERPAEMNALGRLGHIGLSDWPGPVPSFSSPATELTRGVFVTGLCTTKVPVPDSPPPGLLENLEAL